MGLNWAEGLKQTGLGLDKLGAAMEKTDELEYRNMRDANLRRFQLEDQAREDQKLKEKREYDEKIQAGKDTRTDEEKGIVPDSDRGQAILTREEEQRKKKQEDAIALIEKRNEGYLTRNSTAKGVTKQKFVDRAMQDLIKSYREQGEELPQEIYESSLKRFSDQWEIFQTTIGEEGTEGYSPFNVESDPAGLRDLIPKKDD